MSVRTKGLAKFDFHGRQFVWYVDRDRYLRIASTDKKFCISYAWNYPGNLKVYGPEFPGLDASEHRPVYLQAPAPLLPFPSLGELVHSILIWSFDEGKELRRSEKASSGW